MNRREFLAGSAGLLAPRKPPNIVWIMADDLGYGDPSCYGQTKFRTPNIDRIAAEGIRFTDAYSGCTVCAPSRSVLMTGRHMGHTSVRSNPGGVPLLASDVTVAEVLKGAGYTSGCFGKWGLGDLGTEGMPTRQGFDEFFGYLHQVHAHFYYPEYLIHNERRHPLEGNAGGRRATYSHDAIASRALDFVRSAAEPFFAYVPFTIPHWELLAPEDSLAGFRGRFPEDGKLNDPKGHYAHQDHPRAAYAAMITRMDRDIGRILRTLEERGAADNTVVFFASDNGDANAIRGDTFFNSTAGLRGHKQNLYEGGIRVPCVARWPGRIKPGRVSRHPWYFADFLPTAAQLAGLRPPLDIDGISILPELTGGRQSAHEFMYWELPRYDAKTGEFRKEVPMQAVRMGEWKAVRPAPDAPLELYNLARDRAETRDLAAAEPEVLARMRKILETARTEPRPQSQPPHDFNRPPDFR
jgi:arylsulfatase A-like enzyme